MFIADSSVYSQSKNKLLKWKIHFAIDMGVSKQDLYQTRTFVNSSSYGIYSQGSMFYRPNNKSHCLVNTGNLSDPSGSVLGTESIGGDFLNIN